MGGENLKALAPLIGTWHVKMSIYGTMGRSPSLPPIISNDLITTRTWVGDGSYLEETTKGKVSGKPYWRKGWLGYSNIDHRYEWITIAPNVPMMIYRSQPITGNAFPLDLTGTFTDQGLVSEQTVGKPIQQRTVFKVDNNNLNKSDLYFTPPTGKEQLALQVVYTRIK